jgi:hypothetical protein
MRVEIDELKQAVTATDPAAILVAPRVLRRVLQAEFKVPYLLVQAPHERCYFLDREVLFRHVEQDELEIEPDRLLPHTVVLLAKPTAEELEELGHNGALLLYWRLLFHVHVHLELHRRHQEGRLTPADVRARIDKTGQTEFEEIRTVLEQEKDLLTPQDELSVYIEFAAVYLELRYFRSNLRASYFPAIRDFQIIDELLARDVDADALFTRTRLSGAPNPVVHTDTSSDESHDYFWKLLRHAERAEAEDDMVRAGILRTKAARVAPVAQAQPTRAKALHDMEQLTQELQDCLKYSADEAQQWQQVLPALLDKSDQGNWPVEAKLLFDLQEVSMEHRRKTFALDVVEWVLSVGKRPIKRPLTSLQLVRTTQHLRAAAQRLTQARVSDEDRQRLAKLLQSAQQLNENRLRERFRPILRDALHDVGLVATNPPEQVAEQKIIEELLDRILEYGFFTFSDLRDALSRNQLKLPDLSDPQSYWRGDPLLRLDRRLSTLMEGVYRHGEFYLRWLESCSSLFFGTKAGRFLTRNLVFPFGGAWVLVNGVEVGLRDYVNPEASLSWYTYWLTAVFLLVLIRFDGLRHFLAEAGKRTYEGLRLVLYEVPTRILTLPIVRQVFGSWPFLLIYWYVLKPLPVCAAIWWNWPWTFSLRWVALLTFVGIGWLLNSRFGYAITEVFIETLVLLYSWLRFDVLQGLLRWINRFFKQVTATVEYILYTVDEWLRFRSDESRLTLALRAVLGVLWFPIGYLIRIYFLLLLEPTLNPLKLPFSSLAFKLMLLLPAYRHVVLSPATDQEWLAQYMDESLAMVLTYTVIIPTFWLLPGVFAFFFWEMYANWRLFRSNRSARLKPVGVGRHGETMLQLLEAGFHSGTIPRLFAQLRRAERTAYRTDDWRPARAYRQTLHEVARSVQVFIEREFIMLLQQSKSWASQPVSVAQIVLSCNRIRIELRHADYPREPLWLAFAEHAGWLIGSVEEAGWLKHLTPEQRQVMTSALAGLYKLAGVDLVREQLDAVLMPSVPGYDITDHQLVLWTGPRNGHGITYELTDRYDRLRPHRRNGQDLTQLPALDARRLFFSRVPLTWEQWVECWQKDHEGKGHPHLLGDGVVLGLPELHQTA